MFSDRWWILKAAAAAGLLALLLNASRQTLSALHPDVEWVGLNWTSVRDHTFHLAAKQVQSIDETGFVIGTKVGPMRVLTSKPPRPGEYVTANVRAIGPRTLELVRLEVLQGYAWKRPLNYGISVLTLIAYLWLVRKRFRWRIPEGVFRSRY